MSRGRRSAWWCEGRACPTSWMMRFPLRCRVDGNGLWAPCRPQYSAGAMDGSRYRRAVGVAIRRACVELCWWSGGEGGCRLRLATLISSSGSRLSGWLLQAYWTTRRGATSYIGSSMPKQWFRAWWTRVASPFWHRVWREGEENGGRRSLLSRSTSFADSGGHFGQCHRMERDGVQHREPPRASLV